MCLENDWNSGKLKIKITSQNGEPGNIFCGDINKFRNCFLNNTDLNSILRWALSENNYQVTFKKDSE